MKQSGLLLDTCAILFSAEGQEVASIAEVQIEEASATNSLYVSPVSAWEIGRLVAGRKLKLPIDPMKYFSTFIEKTSAQVCALTSDIMMNSSFLPHFMHRDPMDCMLISAARANNFTLVTRDQKILAYGAEGHVQTLAC